VPNGVQQKYQFHVDYEKVMFFVLQVPVTNSIYHTVHLNITGIDTQRSFYPGVYLNQIQMDAEPSVDEFQDYDFPDVQAYMLKFGDDIHDVHNRTEVYKFDGECRQSYCYYLITMYKNSYGLDDVRKPQFEFTARAWQTSTSSTGRRLRSPQDLSEGFDDTFVGFQGEDPTHHTLQ